MDSGNSGSMQSSSGGDEEYDSRAESISAFLTGGGGHFSLMPNPPPPPPPHPTQPTHHHDNMFDPFSNYFDPLSSSSSRSSLQLSNTTNPNSPLHLDMVWSKSLRSEPNCTDLGGLFMASSSSSSSTQQLFTNQAALQGRTTTAAVTHFPADLLHIPQGITESVAKSSSFSAGLASVSGMNMDQTNNRNSINMARNPKKRSRASRRAPTTVLTTDTTNFRAMVQEFTGIPAPPFASSPFPRTRLDLFSSPTSNFRLNPTTHLDSSPQPSYLLRPFAQKLNPTIPFVSPLTNSSSSSILEAIASSSTTTTTNIISSNNINNHCNNSNSTSINYQLPQNLLMQNPILNLQSLLQVPPKYSPISNSHMLETKPPSSLDISPNDSHHKIGVLEELGLSHGHLNTNLGGLQSLVSSDAATAATLPIRPSDNINPTTRWPADGGGECGKVNNFSATSSSDFHRDKGQENVATTTRTEGMVESWICSSD